MKNFKNILVLENDSEFQGVPRLLKKHLDEFDCDKEYWFDFSRDMEVETEASMKKLMTVDENTFCLCYPQFVGAAFKNYMFMLYSLPDHCSINIGVIQPDSSDSLKQKLVNYIYDGFNKAKRLRSIEMIKKVLTNNNIYSISTNGINYEYEKIEFEDIMEYYYETDRKNPDIVKIIETGEEYPVVYVNKYLDDFHLTLRIPEDYNNKYKIEDVKRITH